jgi:hypothetical protein
MKHPTILVPNGENNLSSITGVYKILKKANSFNKKNEKNELFTIQLAGISEKVDFNEGIIYCKTAQNSKKASSLNTKYNHFGIQ